jgi:hypothetical protein
VTVDYEIYNKVREEVVEKLNADQVLSLDAKIVAEVNEELTAYAWDWRPQVDLRYAADEPTLRAAQFLVGGLIFSSYAAAMGADHVLQPKRSTASVTAAEALADRGGFATTLPAAKRKHPHLAGPGRNTALTSTVQATLCDFIRKGNYTTIACKAAGVSPDTLSRWRKRGEQGQEPFAAFVRQLEQAELDAETALVEIWRNQAPGDWRAARNLLARRFPLLPA